MKKLLGLVFNRWTLWAVLLLATALTIWIVGPLVAVAGRSPLESEPARWLAIGLLALAVVARLVWGAVSARRGNSAVVSALLATAPAAADDAASSPDLLAVRQRFEQALQTLREARFGGSGRLAAWSAKLNGRYLYELPWYLIIGAPGSGKTTALQNCGLKFPLAARLGEHALQGVGGTRHCDWWFTDQAVIIDTAGRFTTQDSDRENNRATWSGFLALLKRARPRQPLNGVLVTVSVELLLRSAVERSDYAEKVRQRVQELHQELGLRFPVYLLVTKSDLLAGFTDYFATLDKDQRATPWGTTFTLQDGSASNLQRFGAEFDALQRRLHDGLVERLQVEADPERRARIYGFPNQFARLQGALQAFLDSVFAPSRFEADPLLRGVYFISGTQEGTPIDRVLGAVARAYRLESIAIAPNQASGRSFFLSRLLGEVVFAEHGLAGSNLKWVRRRRLMTAAASVSLAVLTVAIVSAWGVSYVNNRRYIEDVARQVQQVHQLVQATPNRASPDLLPIVPALDATRELARGPAELPRTLGFGLEQVAKLDSAARAAYQRMLVDAVLPRLALRVEEQLRQASGGEAPYEALKIYLMLHDAEHFEPEALKAYFETDWDTQLGRSVDGEQRAGLSQHIAVLLDQGAAVSPLQPDAALVQFHRDRLATTTLPQRIYARMRHQGLGADYPEFTAVRAGGDKAALVFTRVSGEPLTKGVPGLFSYDGYHRGFQKEVARVASQLASEQSWVLGIADAPKDAAALVRADTALLDAVRRLYLNDYVEAWERYIADLKLQPMTSMAQSIQMAQLLSAPDSPLPPLMKAMSKQTTLLAADGKNIAEKAGGSAKKALENTREAIAGALAGTKPRPGVAIESLVDERFASLRRLVTAPEGGKPPLDDTLALIGEVQVLLTAVDNAVKGGTTPPLSPLPVKVKAAASGLPQPLRSMLDELSVTSAKVTQVMVRQNIASEVKSQVGEFCQQAVAGRYPLDRNASRDATQADFATLFAPGGKIDVLFQQKLAPYVDTSARPTWRFRAGESGPLGNDAGTLPQFQRAQAIRETFFPAGNLPSMRLQFKPVEMDATLKQFILDIDGQIVRYDHGPQIPTQIQWPGPRSSSQVRVQLSPALAGGASGMVYDGPWALFRLFDHVKIEPSGAPERFRATFDIDGRKAVFEVTASSVRNPFRLRELSEFVCPAGL
jgi:type VI secretion system protein ImpL